jgi:uncharacterized membrane protein
MTKTRIEFLSDGVFAIVMTLLVLELRVPEATLDDAELWRALLGLAPQFVSYFISFAVLAMFWTMHHAMFHLALKGVNRVLLVPALFYLCFLSLVPFSAHLLGVHPRSKVAAAFYGLNVLAISLAHVGIFHYGSRHPELANSIPPDVLRQARIRHWFVPICTGLGMIATTVSIPLALFLYAVPVPWTVMPGFLSLSERVFSRKSSPLRPNT